MKPNSIVVVSLHSPKEKIWGVLEEINPAGAVVHGVDLNSFEDWLKQVGTEEQMGLTTAFYPMYRIERIALDEAVGSIPSLATTFQQKTSFTLLEYLGQYH
jgi:hypothetical protein